VWRGCIPRSTGCHGSTCSAEPFRVSGRVGSLVGSSPPSPFHPQSLSHPTAFLSQPTPRPGLTAAGREAGTGSAKCVCAAASGHACVRGGGSAHIPHHASLCSYLLPTRMPLQPAQPSLHAWGSLSPPVPLPQPWGVWGLPSPRCPLLTLLPSPQAPGAGRRRAAAGAPRQAPPALHGQLHQHQVRRAGPWGAAAAAPAVHSHPELGARRDWAVVGMERGSALPSLTLCPPLPGSVVGPALTFRIRQNPQNLSLVDVASQAGELGRGPPGPAPLLPPAPPSFGVPCPRDQEEAAPPCIPVPLAELGSWRGVSSCWGYPLVLSLGEVSLVVGKHPSDHLLSIYRAREGRAGGRAGPEDRADGSGRGRSKAWPSLGAGAAGERAVGVLPRGANREAPCAPALSSGLSVSRPCGAGGQLRSRGLWAACGLLVGDSTRVIWDGLEQD